MTSGYVYGSAAEAEAAFAGEHDRYIYSRYGNPTVSVFEERLRLLEGAEAAMATASGMAAVFASLVSVVVPATELLRHGPSSVPATSSSPRSSPAWASTPN